MSGGVSVWLVLVAVAPRGRPVALNVTRECAVGSFAAMEKVTGVPGVAVIGPGLLKTMFGGSSVMEMKLIMRSTGVLDLTLLLLSRS